MLQIVQSIPMPFNFIIDNGPEPPEEPPSPPPPPKVEVPRGVITRLTTQLRESIQARSMSTAGERSALRKAFKDIDADHSGLIDLPEFCAALERFGLHTANTGLKGGSGGINDETVKALFDFFDADHSGTLTYAEFEEALLQPERPMAAPLIRVKPRVRNTGVS